MRRIAAVSIWLALSGAPMPARAFLGTGLNGVWNAQNHLAANPPLPMLRYEEGTWRLNLQPAYFYGRPGIGEASQALYEADGSFKGFAAGACLSYAFAPRWGAYAWALGSASGGDTVITPRAACVNCGRYEFDGVRSRSALFSAGLVRQFWGGEGSRLSVPVFFGPLLSHSSSKQSVRRVYLGSVIDDFDMEISDLSLGLGAGAQAALRLGKGFELVPFLLGGVFFTDACRPYRVTRQGADSGLSAFSENACSGDGARRLAIGEDPFVFAGGVNLGYEPWGLSLNLTAPFLSRLLEPTNAEVPLLSLSWGFPRSTR